MSEFDNYLNLMRYADNHPSEDDSNADGEMVAMSPDQEANGQEEPLSGHISGDGAVEQLDATLSPDAAGQPGPSSGELGNAIAAITGFQSLVRGQQARSHVQVSHVDSGIVHVQIKGDSNTFARVGIEGLNTQSGPKELHYLRVPTEGFQGRVVGGDQIHYDDKDNPVTDQNSQQGLVINTAPEEKSHAYINGGYFNLVGLAKANKPSHTPIGKTATGGEPVKSLPVPRKYRNKYKTLSFGDGSKVTSGPVLSENGQARFSQDKLNKSKYQYKGNNTNKPGVLKHAQHPNPRSGVSMPRAASSEDANRLAVGLTNGKRGSAGTGFTMPEWSTTMARLDRLNQSPSSSVNLDGGGSSALGVVNSQGDKLLDKREDISRGASTLITFSGDQE